MKQWYAKELSQLTQVSVRTLHHYDKIGLLKPSMRLSNGYRVYSEKDLLRLQQIIALKFFGFKLVQINTLLTKQDDAMDNFAMQAKFLREKAHALQEASLILMRITEDCSHDKSVSWEKIIQLIEVYQMTKQLENTWVKEIFTPNELNQYAEFEKGIQASGHSELFKKQWHALVAELKHNIQNDPASKIGVEIGKKFMGWVNEVYGTKYAHLRTKKLEEGFGESKGLDEIDLTQTQVAWLEKALNAYWKDRITSLLNQVGKISAATALKLWNEIIDEMYGEDEVTKNERKKMIIEMILKEDSISQEAKDWLSGL